MLDVQSSPSSCIEDKSSLVVGPKTDMLVDRVGLVGPSSALVRLILPSLSLVLPLLGPCRLPYGVKDVLRGRMDAPETKF